jgi:hypothetical protein
MKTQLNMANVVKVLVSILFSILAFFVYILVTEGDKTVNLLDKLWLVMLGTIFIFFAVDFLFLNFFSRKIWHHLSPQRKKVSEMIKNSTIYIFYIKHIQQDLSVLIGLFLISLAPVVLVISSNAVLVSIILLTYGIKIIANQKNSYIGKALKKLLKYLLNIFVIVPFNFIRPIFINFFKIFIIIPIKIIWAIITSTIFKWLVGVLMGIVVLFAFGAMLSGISATTIIIILLVLILLK